VLIMIQKTGIKLYIT